MCGFFSQIPDPVIEQFEPTRAVLWKKWRGTILEDIWGATMVNMGVALIVCIAFRHLEAGYPNVSEQLFKVNT